MRDHVLDAEDGRDLAGRTAVRGCTGILVTDTADVYLVEPFLAEFDRRGASGTAVRLAAAAPGHGVGFCVTGGIISHAGWASTGTAPG